MMQAPRNQEPICFCFNLRFESMPDGNLVARNRCEVKTEALNAANGTLNL